MATNLNERDAFIKLELKKNKALKSEMERVYKKHNYKMPKNHIQWRELSGIVSYSVNIVDRFALSNDISEYQMHLPLRDWHYSNAPIYSINNDAYDLLKNAHSEPQRLNADDIKLSSFILTVPKGLIPFAAGSEVDYIAVRFLKKGVSKDIDNSLDILARLGHGLDNESKLLISHMDIKGGHCSRFCTFNNDFLDVTFGEHSIVQNIVFNTLLTFKKKPDGYRKISISECEAGFEGFGQNSVYRYPRSFEWENIVTTYTHLENTPKGTHISPVPHLRRGHFRRLKGKPEPIPVKEAKVNFNKK